MGGTEREGCLLANRGYVCCTHEVGERCVELPCESQICISAFRRSFYMSGLDACNDFCCTDRLCSMPHDTSIIWRERYPRRGGALSTQGGSVPTLRKERETFDSWVALLSNLKT